MRQDGPYGLGVDLGTSNTVAVLYTPDGRTRPLLFDGQPIMPSGVYLDPEGRLHVGRDAQRLAQADPARYEPNPKRRIDETSVLLGDREVPVVDLLAAVLAAVARAAVEAVGFLPPAMLTHPAAWGPVRRETLAQAVARAGWPPVGPRGIRFTPEPVAAARYFAEVLSRPVPAGSALAVFDFGGGTLDVAVVRNDGLGPAGRPVFSVVSSGGVADLGGLDLDAALVEHVGRLLTAPSPHAAPDGPTQRLDIGAAQAWEALLRPATATQWRNRRQLWDDVRGAKEMLSRATVAPIAVPGVERAVHLTREELEQVITPLLRRGVHETAGVIRAAGTTPDRLAGLFLVGGSSRVPMVGRLLHSDLHIAPTVLEQPELPVAEGALAELLSTAAPIAPPVSPASAPPVSPASVPPVSAPPISGPPTSGPPASAPPVYSGPPPKSRRPLLLAGLAASVVLILLVTAGVVYLSGWNRPSRITFQTMEPGTEFPAVTDDPDAYVSDFFTGVVGDRAFVAAQRPDKTLEIKGIDLARNERLWLQTTAQAAPVSWSELHTTERYVIVAGAPFTDDSPGPLAVYDRDGTHLWNGELALNQQFVVFEDRLVLIDPKGRKLVGLDLATGDPRWELPVPVGEFSEAFRIARISSPGELTGPARPGGTPMWPNPAAAQRFVLVTSDQRARVVDATNGRVTSERSVAIEPAYLTPSLGMQILADDDRLYIGTTGDGYRIDAYDLDSDAAPVVVYNGAHDRRLETLIPCGDDRLCLADIGEENTEAVAAVDVPADGTAKEAWRRDDVKGLVATTDPGAMVATGDGLLVWRKAEDGSFRTSLYDAAGTKVFDWSGVGARLNARSFLLFDRAFSSSGAESVPLAAVVDDDRDPQQIGTLIEARLGSCSWNATTIVCGSGDNGFRVQHFAED
ncbi:Hsp70 family protein [Catenuloplanes atrovinosus]|uniref:Outer membrane protein assembly factor BamB n=1 Tax=Catenuloplanes atrovinosus TaxID=137266 RepID=A0AAE3YXC9_9ACTN|nr:Hsp70 family protein [Catenuloplanes atrovinosus]MDR7280351.1 outer membrane protein assembly factor BamB [Catenuloplanes atrovinosus]